MMTVHRLKRDAMASAQELADAQSAATFVYRDGRNYIVTYHAPMNGTPFWTLHSAYYVVARSEFVKGYVECALWASYCATDGGSLDKNYSVNDIAPSSLRSMIDDCVDFQNAHVHDLCRGAHPLAPDYARAGHDFWLTRNRHGAGFWDGDWNEPAGFWDGGDWNEPAATVLTDSSHAYGESYLYVGDDGRIYVTP